MSKLITPTEFFSSMNWEDTYATVVTKLIGWSMPCMAWGHTCVLLRCASHSPRFVVISKLKVVVVAITTTMSVTIAKIETSLCTHVQKMSMISQSRVSCWLCECMYMPPTKQKFGDIIESCDYTITMVSENPHSLSPTYAHSLWDQLRNKTNSWK